MLMTDRKTADGRKSPRENRRIAYAAFIAALDRADEQSAEGGSIEIVTSATGAAFKTETEDTQVSVPICGRLKLLR